MSTFVFGIAVWGASATLAAASLIALGWATLILTALRRLRTAPQHRSCQRSQGR